MSSDPDLEEIQKRKLQELRMRLAAEQQRIEKQKALETQKQAVLRQVLTTEARQRINRIKLVRPQFAEQIELQLIQAVQLGQLQFPVTDTQLKTLLKKLQTRKKKIKFRRI